MKRTRKRSKGRPALDKGPQDPQIAVGSSSTVCEAEPPQPPPFTEAELALPSEDIFDKVDGLLPSDTNIQSSISEFTPEERDAYDETMQEGMPLTSKQWKFVAAYAGTACGNSTVAALIAYDHKIRTLDARIIGKQLLDNAKVQEGIALALSRSRDTVEWARHTLLDVASSNMANFVVVDSFGGIRFDFNKAKENGSLGQIKSLEQIEKTLPGGATIVRTKLTLHDKVPALIAIMKLHGLMSEQVKHSGVISLQPMTFDGDRDIDMLPPTSPEQAEERLKAITASEDALISESGYASIIDAETTDNNDSRQGTPTLEMVITTRRDASST